MPGNNSNYFYICLGRIPHTHKNGKQKINLPFICILLFSFAAHIYGGVRYYLLKLKEKKRVGAGK
jgi:hypothetical protein